MPRVNPSTLSRLKRMLGQPLTRPRDGATITDLLRAWPGLVLILTPMTLALLWACAGGLDCQTKTRLMLAFILSMPTALALAIWLNWNPEARFQREYLDLVRRAEAGDAAAQCQLAQHYLDGVRGSGRDEISARFWLQRASSQGHTQATDLLATLERDGIPDIGAEHNPESVAESDELPPAESRADRMLAWLLTTPLLLLLIFCVLGLGLFVGGIALVLVLLAWSASQFGAIAMGMLLASAMAVVAGLFWWLRSPNMDFSRKTRRLFHRAEDGDPEAQRELAMAYLAGHRDLPKDSSQALWWLRRCAEQGDARAAYLLAQWLDQGLGQHRNRKDAQAWLLRAQDAGYGPASALWKRWEARDRINLGD